MTSTEMHTHLDLELDKTSALDLPAFTDDEKDLWLNLATKKFVKTRYSGLNVKKQGFEETQKRLDDLRTLVSTEDIDLTTTGANWSSTTPLYQGYINDDTFGYATATYASDYWFTLGEEATITVSGTAKKVAVDGCTQNELVRKINDPFSEYHLHYTTAKPLRIFYGNSVELISDGNYTVDTYHLTYLKVPATIDLSTTDCDLPEHTHEEIVRIAANMMLENIESPRYQSHAGEVATME